MTKEEAKTKEQSILTDEVLTEIRNNVPLRRMIADYIGVTDSTVYGHCQRNAPRLNDYVIVKMIMASTGKTQKEVVKPEALKYVQQ